MDDISLDIETLGIQPGCVILSIGACEFNREQIGKLFHAHIDVEDSVRRGATMDARTVLWWLGQSKQAQEAILSTSTHMFEAALMDLEEAFSWENKRIWCKGASFDFPILRSAYKTVDMVPPWPYYNEMDLRTVKRLLTKDDWNSCKVAPDLPHDALEDALAQARTIQNIDLAWPYSSERRKDTRKMTA